MDSAGDEAALERELEEHLEENQASLQAVEEALADDVDNYELITIREELHQAVKGAEESLLHLKRARLFREVDAMAQHQEPASEAVSGSAMVEAVSALPFSVSSKCRFRHSNGRWYNGCILGMENDSVARVAFLHPTSDKMQDFTFTDLLLSYTTSRLFIRKRFLKRVRLKCRCADFSCSNNVDLVLSAVYLMGWKLS